MSLSSRIEDSDRRTEEFLKKLEEEQEKKIQHLTSDSVYNQNMENAEKERKKLNEEQADKLKRLCKFNLFFLCYSILQYDRLSPNLHGHLCSWLEKTKTERYREILLPRGHFKSTIVTISGNLQKILPFELDQFEYPLNLGTNIRILISHEVATMASGYLLSITNQIMSNPILMALFPEIVPNPRVQKINRSELELPRTKIWNEATITAGGVGMRAQGWHFDHTTYDDIIGEKARDSLTEMNTAKTWFDSTPGFRVKLGSSTFDVVGTRYGPDDVYEHIEDRYEKTLKVYRRAIEEKIEIEPGKFELRTIFPEEIKEEDLVVLKKNKQVFSSQYMNEPEGGDLKFDPETLRHYWWSGQYQIVIPPDRDRGIQRELLNVHDFYKVLLLDPSVSRKCGWCVTGTDVKNRNFMLEGGQEELSPPQQIDLLFRMQMKYNLNMVAIEDDVFMALFQDWLPREMLLRSISFPLMGVSTNKQEKEVRVRGLATYLESNLLWHNGERFSKAQDKTTKYDDLEYQIRKFGSIKEYHLLDAIAHGPKVWMPGYNRKEKEIESKNSLTNIDNSRSVNTGYSKINYGKRR